MKTLHSHGLAHMDLKPSNIVISEAGDAVIIDVSGAALTQDWLGPEMREVFSPCSSSLEERQRNDAWAFGKILTRMVAALYSTPEGMGNINNDTDELRAVVEALMHDDPRQRCSLATVLSRLEAIQLRLQRNTLDPTSHSTIIPVNLGSRETAIGSVTYQL